MADKIVRVKVTDQGLSETTTKAQKLNKELDRVFTPRKVMSASKAIDTTQISTGLGRGTAAAGDRGDSRDFARQAQGLGGLVHVYATFAANVFAVAAAFNALSRAADFSNMQKAADVLSLKVGVSIIGLAKDIKTATDGAISLSDALSSASLATSAGLATKQIKDLTTVAKGASIALGRDMSDALSRVFRGTIKIEPELLDELGLMVKVNDVNKDYARTLKKSVSSLTDFERRQAFVNGVVSQGLSKYKELADQSANPYSKLLSGIKDLGTTILNVLNNVLGPFISALSKSPTALLLGLGAIATLLLKQAVPALSNMKQGWDDAAKAAQASVLKQKDLVEQRKAAILSSNKATTDAALMSFTATRDKLLKEATKGSGLNSYKGVKEATGLSNFIGLSPEGIEAQKRKIVGLLTTVQSDIQQKLNAQLDKLAQKDNISEKAYNKASLAQAKFKVQIASMQELIKSIDPIAAAAKTNAISQAALVNADANIAALNTKLTKFEQIGQRAEVINRGIETSSKSGVLAGFRDLNAALKEGAVGADGVTRSFTNMEKLTTRIKGGFGILTVSASKLLGTFSVWSAVIGIAIIAINSLFTWMGLLTDKAAKLSDSLTTVNETLKLNSEIQDKLKSATNLAEMYELQASSAKSYADALEQIIDASKKLIDFQNNGTWLDKGIESIKSLAGKGIIGADTYKESAKAFDTRMASDKTFASKYKGLLGGKSATELIGTSNISFDNKLSGIKEFMAALVDPELEKSSKEFAENSLAMKNNLKELDTISGDYLLTLENQSKYLKALNAFSSSSVNLFKELGNPNGGIANISVFLTGITDQFQEMSRVDLSTPLQALKDNLVQIQKTAEENYNRKTTGLTGSPSQIASAKILAADAKTAEIKSKAEQALIDTFGSRKAAEVALAQQNYKTAQSLSKLAATAATASIEQAKLARNLKLTQLLGSFSGRNEATTYSAEIAAERRKIAIENSAQITNVNAVQKQLEIETAGLRAELGGWAKLAGPELLKSIALTKINSESTDSVQRGNIVGALSRMEGLNAQIKIATATITTNNLGLASGAEVALQTALKNAAGKETIAGETTKLNLAKESTKLAEKFNGITDIGSEYIDALHSYKTATLNSEAEIANLGAAALKAKEILVAFTNTRLLSSATKDQKANLAGDIATATTGKQEADSKLRLAMLAKEKADTTENYRLELDSLKQALLLKVRSGELDIISNRMSNEDLDILKINILYEEETLRLRKAQTDSNRELVSIDLDRAKATKDHAVKIIEENRLSRIQKDTLVNIDSILNSNKPSTGLLNINQITLITDKFNEINAIERERDQNLVNQLSGGEKLLAQEALRVKYLEKQLAIDESILLSNEKLTSPFEVNKELLSKRFDTEARKFRDTLDSYNNTIVQASFSAVDTFVNGIGNAVKNLDFNLKTIIRDTVFAFDDMMMEYAGNQLKAIMKNALSQYFKIDISTPQEKATQLQVENSINLLEETRTQTNILQTIADNISMVGSTTQPIDPLIKKQGELTKQDAKSSGTISDASSTFWNSATIMQASSVALMGAIAGAASGGSKGAIKGAAIAGLGSLFTSGFSNSFGLSDQNLLGSAASLFGFASGGSFKVGGQGATDSKLVQFMATPGEQVTVKTPKQQNSSEGNPVYVTNNFTITGGTTSRESQQQISAKVGLAIQRSLSRNN